MIKSTLALLVLVVVSGCTYSTGPYAVSPGNVQSLRGMDEQKVNVGEFTSSDTPKSEIFCRGSGNVSTPEAMTFANYIEEAFIAELVIADMYADSAPVTLTGSLDQLDFSSTQGVWDIELTVMSSNGQEIVVQEQYEFESAFSAEAACTNVATAFMPAVRHLLAQVIEHPEFSMLISR